MQPLPNGNTFVGWGSNRWFSEYDATGRLVLDGRLSRGNDSYRAYRGGWVGRPTTKPSVVRRGALHVRELERRHRRHRLASRPGRAGPADRLETRVPIGATVRALDAAGNVLGEA